MCEACFIEKRGTWLADPETPDQFQLVAVPRPNLMVTPPDEDGIVEQCCWCLRPTILGLYTRNDPADVELACNGGTTGTHAA